MGERLRSLLVVHGVLIFLAGMIAGFPFAFHILGRVELWPIPGWLDIQIPGDYRGWRMAHLEGILNGLLLMGVAAIGGLLRSSDRAARWAVWAFIGPSARFAINLTIAEDDAMQKCALDSYAASWIPALASVRHSFARLSPSVGASACGALRLPVLLRIHLNTGISVTRKLASSPARRKMGVAVDHASRIRSPTTFWLRSIPQGDTSTSRGAGRKSASAEPTPAMSRLRSDGQRHSDFGVSVG